MEAAIGTHEALRIEATLAVREAQTERQHVDALIVTTPEEYRVAAETLKSLTARHRDIDAKRKQATKPLDEAKKTIMAWFRPAIDDLEAAIEALRRSLTTYEQRQAEVQRIAAAEYSRALIDGRKPDQAALAKAFSDAPVLDGVQTKHLWDFEIIDAGAVPRQFLKVDEQKIRAFVTAMKADAKIPGVRVFQKTVHAVVKE